MFHREESINRGAVNRMATLWFRCVEFIYSKSDICTGDIWQMGCKQYNLVIGQDAVYHRNYAYNLPFVVE